MKGCIVGGIVLALVIVTVACNAVFVHSFVQELSEAVAALPAEPDTVKTPAALRELSALLEERMPILGLSVSVSVTERVTEGLASAESFAASGDRVQYRAAIAVLRELIADIGRLERFSIENLL